MSTATLPVEIWERRARWLALATVAYNLVEGGVATAFGWSEGSVALFGFGVDSFVEVGSAGMVLWRLQATGCADTRRLRERRATRGISALFGILAVGIAVGSLARLVTQTPPESTLPGVVVSLASLGFMAFLWRAKVVVAERLDSRTVAMDAACSLACIQLSFVLLAGSLLYLVAPALWWADAVAGLGLAALVGREGLEGWRAAGREDFAGGCGCH